VNCALGGVKLGARLDRSSTDPIVSAPAALPLSS
jgi:hypothetical protein